MRSRAPEVRMFLGVFACAVALGLVFPRAAPETYDSDIMLQVTESIVRDGSFVVHDDPKGVNTPYSFYGVGMSLLMAGPYWLAERVGADPTAWAMDVNAILFAVLVVAGVAFARLTGLTRGEAVAVGALVMFGTNLLPYTATAFSEPGVAVGVAGGMLGLLGTSKGRSWGVPLAGAGAGLALLMRTDSLVLVVPIVALGAWLLTGRQLATAIPFSAGFAPFFAGWAAYNHLRYGAPWRLGYEDNPFNHDVVRGVVGHVISPGRGLLLYVPLAAVVIAVMIASRRRAPVLTAVALGLVVLRILFYAPWFAWYGGWCFGPRFLLPAMPALTLGFVELVRRLPRLAPPAQAAVGVLVLLSVIVQLAGAAVAYERSDLVTEGFSTANWDAGPAGTSQENQRIIDDALFDWSLFPIPDHIGRMVRGEDLAGRIFDTRDHTRRIAGLAVLLVAGVWFCWTSLRVADQSTTRVPEAARGGKNRRVATSSRKAS